MVSRMQRPDSTGVSFRCLSRAWKNRQHVQQYAPELWDEAQAKGRIPSEVLDRLHRLKSGASELKDLPRISEFLAAHPFPRIGRIPRSALFSGTIHFAWVTFETKSGTYQIGSADMNQILQYARRAIAPIAAYASQYGTANPRVAAQLVQQTIQTSSTVYNDWNLKQWVEDIASVGGVPPGDALFIINPPHMENDFSNGSGNDGYHGTTGEWPYLFLNVFGTGLTLSDAGDAYAMGVSHEMAEMIVDPLADKTNPEVCDPCDITCGTNPPYRAYFDAQDSYLGTSRAFPPAMPYAYYIAAVVDPASAGMCSSNPPISPAACTYAPPVVPRMPSPIPMSTWLLLFQEVMTEHLRMIGDTGPLLQSLEEQRPKLAAITIVALADEIGDAEVGGEIKSLAGKLLTSHRDARPT